MVEKDPHNYTWLIYFKHEQRFDGQDTKDKLLFKYIHNICHSHYAVGATYRIHVPIMRHFRRHIIQIKLNLKHDPLGPGPVKLLELIHF